MVLEDYHAYTELMHEFLIGNITADTFAVRYQTLYVSDYTLHPVPIYHVFDDLLAVIKSTILINGDAAIPIEHISTLKNAVKKTLEQIHTLFKKSAYLEPVKINSWPAADKLKRHPVSLQEYIALIDKFVTHHITADDFEVAYITLFYSDEGNWSEEKYNILASLFSDCDAYWPACRPQDEIGERPETLSAQTFRKFAAQALEKLTLLATQEP